MAPNTITLNLNGLPIEVFQEFIVPRLSEKDLNSLRQVNNCWRDNVSFARRTLTLYRQSITPSLPFVILGLALNVQCLTLRLLNSGPLQQEPQETTTLTQLISLNLENNKQITDKNLIYLMQQCPNLRDINLFGCTQITDAAVQALAASHPNVRIIR